MTAKLCVFVSSVQKELEDERLIVQNLVNTDAFLSAHCTPVLYELEPASPDKALEGCLQSLDGCQVYLLIVGIEYGTPVGGLSITHAEYRRAKKRKLPVLAFIKGDRSVKREDGTSKLLAELDADGPKYKRFGNVIELQKEVRAALVKLLKDRFGISPTSDENQIAEQTIEATSSFESQPLARLRWQDLDHEVLRRLIAAAENRDAGSLSDGGSRCPAPLLAVLPGVIRATGETYATAAGIVLLAKDPSMVFPQCRILADAYRSTEPDGDPRDHEDIRAPMPLAIDRAIAFIDRNTRHPMRIVGLNRVRLDEYPVDGLREALVNAVAHRQYEDAGRKILLEVFADRVVLSSPGLPPKPITLASLRKGKVSALFAQSGPGPVSFLFPPHRGARQRLPPDARPDARPRARSAAPRHRHGVLPGHLPGAGREHRAPAGAREAAPGHPGGRGAVERTAERYGKSSCWRRGTHQPKMPGTLQTVPPSRLRGLSKTH